MIACRGNSPKDGAPRLESEAALDPVALWGSRPPADPVGGALWVDPVFGVTFVYVPVGEFVMGSNEGQIDEAPAHRVLLDGYWIMQTEVTNSQYGQCVDGGGCSASYDDRWLQPERAEHPVIYVTFQQATQFARWAGGRLPSEAEWEKAARGTDGRLYPWGNDPPTAVHLNFDRNVDDTQPVGSYPNFGSQYGVLDMAGNALEWVGDWYNRNEYGAVVGDAPRQNPTGPEAGAFHLLRGGSWLSNAEFVRTTARKREPPYGDVADAGFRVVRTKMP